MMARGELDYDGFIDLVASSAPSTGYCNTMGTATTMNSLAEALGMQLPGSAAIPAPYAERGKMAYRTGKRIVEMVEEDLRPSRVLTRAAFLNAIRVNSAIGGSTNAPIHLAAIARHMGVELSLQDWQTYGEDVPLLVNLQPAGEYLGEDYFRAGGVPAVVAQLEGADLIDAGALTVTGRSLAEEDRGVPIRDQDVIRSLDHPLVERAGFRVLTGNLFDAAIMKMSVISPQFRERYLSDPQDPEAFCGRAVVFDGPEDYHQRIEDPQLAIDERSILFMRGVGPVGYPGSAEVVNMRAPAALLLRGTHELPCIGDGRQSGTSGSPSILNASPEAAAGGNLALLRTGDEVRVDLRAGRVDMQVPEDELERRRQELERDGGYPVPASQTPWQEIQRGMVDQLAQGMVLKPAVRYQRVAETQGIPRHNH